MIIQSFTCSTISPPTVGERGEAAASRGGDVATPRGGDAAADRCGEAGALVRDGKMQRSDSCCVREWQCWCRV